MADRERDLDQRAVFIISVAAELAGVHPQTLRIYERKGLVRPKRTSGNTRRYSQADIDRLLAIQELTDEGVNLAGVKRIMELRAEVDALRRAGRRPACPARAPARDRDARAALGRHRAAAHRSFSAPWEQRP